MKNAISVIDEVEIPNEVVAASAHRTPESCLG